MKEEKRRKENEHFKIYQGVFDAWTLKTLRELAEKGLFDAIDFPISTGKEADVYRATTKGGGFVAIKIYRIETANFNNLWRYLAGDPRFRGIKKSKRSVICAWCKKEFRNLREATEVGIGVPHPQIAKNNVLIMEFIGEDGSPSPLLKDVVVPDARMMLKTIYAYVKDLWKKARLVHGDLSEYNIMMQGDVPILIDISQAVSIEHPMSHELLQRDLQNIARLARKWKLEFDWEKEYRKVVGE